MRLLVTGSRNGHQHVRAVLDRWRARYGAPDWLIVGDEPSGVDRSALEWAIDGGAFFVVWCADWQRHSNAAGPVRNSKMCVLAEPGAHCIGFPVGESRGTRGCMAIAHATGLIVHEVDLRGTPHRYTVPAREP